MAGTSSERTSGAGEPHDASEADNAALQAEHAVTCIPIQPADQGAVDSLAEAEPARRHAAPSACGRTDENNTYDKDAHECTSPLETPEGVTTDSAAAASSLELDDNQAVSSVPQSGRRSVTEGGSQPREGRTDVESCSGGAAHWLGEGCQSTKQQGRGAFGHRHASEAPASALLARSLHVRKQAGAAGNNTIWARLHPRYPLTARGGAASLRKVRAHMQFLGCGAWVPGREQTFFRTPRRRTI